MRNVIKMSAVASLSKKSIFCLRFSQPVYQRFSTIREIRYTFTSKCLPQISGNSKLALSQFRPILEFNFRVFRIAKGYRQSISETYRFAIDLLLDPTFWIGIKSTIPHLVTTCFFMLWYYALFHFPQNALEFSDENEKIETDSFLFSKTFSFKFHK